MVSGDAVFAPLFTAQELERSEDRDSGEARRAHCEVRRREQGEAQGEVRPSHGGARAGAPDRSAARRLDDKELAGIQEAPVPYVAPQVDWPIVSLPDDPKKRERLLGTAPSSEVVADLRCVCGYTRDRLNASRRKGKFADPLRRQLGTGRHPLFAEAGARSRPGRRFRRPGSRWRRNRTTGCAASSRRRSR